jgi:hypothetical protein
MMMMLMMLMMLFQWFGWFGWFGWVSMGPLIEGRAQSPSGVVVAKAVMNREHRFWYRQQTIKEYNRTNIYLVHLVHVRMLVNKTVYVIGWISVGNRTVEDYEVSMIAMFLVARFEWTMDYDRWTGVWMMCEIQRDAWRSRKSVPDLY